MVFFASAFSSISIELCHQIMHIPDYLSQSVSIHEQSHKQQDHTHAWLALDADQSSEGLLTESNNPVKLQLINPSQFNTINNSTLFKKQPFSYDLILTSESSDIPVPPPLFA